jgi:hypothetical protein
VSGFLTLSPKTIYFGANAEGAPVLAALQKLPDVPACRSRLTAPLIPTGIGRSPRTACPPWSAHASRTYSRTTWTTVCLDAAVRQLKAQGYSVRKEDMAGLSPVVSRHLGVHGAYNFLLPDLAPGTIRDLRDPDGAEDDDEI